VCTVEDDITTDEESDDEVCTVEDDITTDEESDEAPVLPLQRKATAIPRALKGLSPFNKEGDKEKKQ
jgi:hypothetical protein